MFTSKIVEKRTTREILEKCVTHSNFVYLENSNFCPKIHDKTLIFDIFSREICQQLRSAKSAKIFTNVHCSYKFFRQFSREMQTRNIFTSFFTQTKKFPLTKAEFLDKN